MKLFLMFLFRIGYFVELLLFCILLLILFYFLLFKINEKK